MRIPETLSIVHKELGEVLKRVDEKPLEQLLDMVQSAEKVYVAGQGRSGLVARALAMRLMHLGLTSFVAGETVTPAFLNNDLMIACSGSGETKITLHLARSAKEAGGKLAAVTACPNSSLAGLADIVVHLPCGEGGSKRPGVPTIQMGGSLFEQSALIVFDALVLRLAERTGANMDEVWKRHSNLM